MYNHPAQMEPLFPTYGEKLTDLATELIRRSAVSIH